jgi:hypothetical protein
MSIQQTASVLPSMHASRNAALLAKVRQLEACVEGLAAENNRLAALVSVEAIKNKELTEELSSARSAAFQAHVDLLARERPEDYPVSPVDKAAVTKKFFGKAQFAHRMALAEEKDDAIEGQADMQRLEAEAMQPVADFGVESVESSKSLGQKRRHHIKRLEVERATAWNAKCAHREAKRAGVYGANAGRRAKSLRVTALAEGRFVPSFAQGGVRQRSSKANKAPKGKNRHNSREQLVGLGALQ